MGPAAKERNLQICNGEEEQEVSNVEDASELSALSSSSLCLLVWRRMKGAEGLEEGLFCCGRGVGISHSDEALR